MVPFAYGLPVTFAALLDAAVRKFAEPVEVLITPHVKDYYVEWEGVIKIGRAHV